MNKHKHSSSNLSKAIYFFCTLVFLFYAIYIILYENHRRYLLCEWIIFTAIFYMNIYIIFHLHNIKKICAMVQQLFVPITLGTLFWNLAIICPTTIIDKSIVLYGCLSLNLGFILCLIVQISNLIIYSSNYKSKITQYLSQNWFIFIICLFFFLLTITNFDTWLNEDGVEYYQNISKILNWNFYDLSTLKLAGHHSELYMVILSIGQFMFPHHANGIRIICLLMALLTIIAFNGILNYLFQKNKFEKILLNCIFAFSPFLFGMILEINTDFSLLCFFVWMLYFDLKDKQIMKLFCALLLCFSKETGLLIYAGYVLGHIINMIIKNKQEIFKNPKLFYQSKEVISLVLGGILWLLYFIFVCKFELWSGSKTTKSTLETTMHKINSFGIWDEYIIFRLKEIFLFNFQWFIWGIILIITVFYIYKSHRKKKLKIFLPIILSFIAFLGISLLYITHPHIRYNIFVLIIQTLLLAFLTLQINKKILRKFILSTALCITILSNYVTDPLSQSFFYSVDSGNGSLLCPRLFYYKDGGLYTDRIEDPTEWTFMNEGVAYNRQYIYRSRCIEDLLALVDYNSNDIIIIPNLPNYEYHLYRNILLRQSAWTENLMYWNTKSQTTNANFYFDKNQYYTNDWIKINTFVLNKDKEISPDLLEKYDRVFVLEIPSFNLQTNYHKIIKSYDTKYYSIKNNVWHFGLYELLKHK